MNTQLPIGSRVRVISGRYAGKTGVLLRFEGDRAWVRSDAYATEVAFDVAALALEQFSDHRSETSDHHSETSDHSSENGAIARKAAKCNDSIVSDQRSENSAMDARRSQVSVDLLHAHLNDAIALLHALGTADGWLDSDRKPTSKTYPRYRWREDGAVRSRALAEWEVQPMRDRLRRGRLLRALLEYLG